MSVNDVFRCFVEPAVERIPVLEVRHAETHQGRGFWISQYIRRNVLTEFDRKLSRHLAATRGAGFPAFTVEVTVHALEGDQPPRRLTPAHHPSVPHALKGVVERAFAHCGRVTLTLRPPSAEAEGGQGETAREVGEDEIDALGAALGVCARLGEAEFLDISGDFDMVVVAPPAGLKPAVVQMQNGSVTLPGVDGSMPFECPIHGFAGHAAADPRAQGYLAMARHALVAAKEAAVLDFRAAAEARILGIDRALAGRRLDSHRLDAVKGLVARLTAGLGDGLAGLSEDARITALDWSAELAGATYPLARAAGG